MKYKSTLGLCALILSSVASAEVVVNFDRDLQLLAVNGTELTGNFGHTQQIVLENGINQLLVRAEKVIHMGGNQNKYKSPTMVIKLVASDAQLVAEPSMFIRDETVARAFNRNPSVSITAQQGSLDYSQDVLVSRGMSFLRNYERELARFNQSDSIAAVSSREFTTQHDLSLSQKSHSTDDQTKVEQLKNHFIQLNLSDEEKKAFLSWAISQ